MAEIDKKAQEEYGLPQDVLMENAGRCAFDVIIDEASSIEGERIVIFCGRGNNGGDGFVVARLLFLKSPVSLTVYAPQESLIRRGSAYDNFIKIRDLGVDIKPISMFGAQDIENATLAVDAVFGTGFKGQLPEGLREVSRCVNSKDIKLYAVDVPSGLNATTGEAAIDCFKAHKTITFGLPKAGFYQNDGPGVCGEILVKDIGFPPELLAPYM